METQGKPLILFNFDQNMDEMEGCRWLFLEGLKVQVHHVLGM